MHNDEMERPVIYRAPEARQLAERQLLLPFDYACVRLKPGTFKSQFESMRHFYQSIPDDNILKGFRERAGLPSPGEPLGGWYTADMPLPLVFENRPSTLCHTFGQWLGAFARIYRASGDEAARKKAQYLLDEWGKTVDEKGYFFYGRAPATVHYDFDKTLGGLVDMYEYVGDETALRYAERITEWAMRNLDRRRVPATPDRPGGGGWVGGDDADVEWYTLSENLYRLYLVTGRPDHRAFAETWHYDRYWKRLAAGDAAAMAGLHAYSHVNTLSSAAMAYGVSGDSKYLRAIEGAYDLLQRLQLFPTGGYGPGERLAADREGLCDSVRMQRDSFEVPCGTWAAFKLVRYLQSFTAKACYGDWAERLLYNGIGAALPVGAGGKTYYYADYRASGGAKRYYLDLRFPAGPVSDYTPWPCCSGTYPLAVTDYHNLIYYRDRKSIYINLYLPSVAHMVVGGSPVSIEMDTDYPNSGRSSITVRTPKEASFGLRFRVPGWVRGKVSVQLNGQEVRVKGVPGGWREVERTWRDGDSAVIDIPLDLRLEPVGNRGSDLAALMYGPVALATDDEGSIETSGSLRLIHRVKDELLSFEMRGKTATRVFRPFYEFREGERYYLFHPVGGG